MKPPDIGPRKFIGRSVRKRWDENTPSSKGPHILYQPTYLGRSSAPLPRVGTPPANRLKYYFFYYYYYYYCCCY